MLRPLRPLLPFALLAPFACGGLACSSSTSGSAPLGAAINGTLGGSAFSVADALVLHPQHWKSAAAGSTAVLLSDTPNVCAQITAGKTPAPGRIVLVRLEQRGADGAITALSAGSFDGTGEGQPSSRFADVYGSAVDAACHLTKFFQNREVISVTQVDSGSTPIAGSIDVTFDSGDSLKGSFSVSATCDETAVDAWLNGSARCN
jgi:hypothetical protein